MDTQVEYRSLWKMSLGQVAGSLVMVALGIVDVIIKSEKCSAEGHTYMPGFCLAMAIWLPAFLLLIALLTFTIGPEKEENHDKLIFGNIVACLFGILLCMALVGWSVLNISHTVDLEMPTEKGYSTIVVPCFVIPLSFLVATFSVFNIKSAFKLLRIRTERKVEPVKVTTEDGETVRMIHYVPWWQKLGRQSEMSVHSSLVSQSMLSFQSEVDSVCGEHTPGGFCATCDDYGIGRSYSASVLEESRHITFRPSSIPDAIFSYPDSVCDFQENVYESIDPSRWLLPDNRQLATKPPRLPARNNKRVDPNIFPLKPVVHTHKFHNRVAPDRRKGSAKSTKRLQAPPSATATHNPSKARETRKLSEGSDDKIFAISGKQRHPRPVSRVPPLRHPAGRNQTNFRALRAPSRGKKVPQPSQQQPKAGRRKSHHHLSNSITIIRVDNLESVCYDV